MRKEKNSPMAQETSVSLGPFFILPHAILLLVATCVVVLCPPSDPVPVPLCKQLLAAGYCGGGGGGGSGNGGGGVIVCHLLFLSSFPVSLSSVCHLLFPFPLSLIVGC